MRMIFTLEYFFLLINTLLCKFSINFHILPKVGRVYFLKKCSSIIGNPGSKVRRTDKSIYETDSFHNLMHCVLCIAYLKDWAL